MPTETIRYQVTGANPTSGTIAVNFANNGSGTGSITLNGANSGVDTIQTFLDKFSLSSNAAQCVWQGINGPISIGPISGYFRSGGNGLLATGLTISNFSGPQSFNSLMFNTHPNSILPGDPHASGNQANPMVNNSITSSGVYAGDTAVSGDSGGGIDLCLVGSFIIAEAGSITFTTYVNSAHMIGCPGASYVSGAADFGTAPANTPVKNYPRLAGRSGDWPGGNFAVDTYTLNFPEPGVYPFEIYFASGNASERQYCLLANNAVIPPGNLVTVPPAPAAGTGQMILTPTSAGPDILGNQQTFTITVSGLQFQSTQYFPVLEGTDAALLIINNANGTFTFPSLPQGGSVDPAAALASILELSGDNTSWQNKIGITWDGTNHRYVLAYNGAAIDPNVPVTALTITNPNIAWFDTTNDAVDTFGVTNQGGGSSTVLPIYWLVNPQIVSCSPTTLNGDGGTYPLVLSLAKPLPPLQANITAAFSAGSAFTIVSQQANTNSAGWIIGWTVNVQTNVLSVNQSTSLNATLSDTSGLGYMSGGTFTTASITYPNADPATFNLLILGTANIPAGVGVFNPNGGTNCPASDMFLRKGLLAAYGETGMELDCLSADFHSVEKHEIQRTASAREECVEIVAANGARVTVSSMTPVPTIEAKKQIDENNASLDEIKAFAHQIEPGMHVYTLVDDVLEISEVLSVENVGIKNVACLSLGGRNFAAGSEARLRIFTHNISVVAKGL